MDRQFNDNVNAPVKDRPNTTVIVEIKYISDESIVIHTENCKILMCLDDKAYPKEIEKTLISKCGIKTSSKRRGVTDFSLEIFYIDAVEEGSSKKAIFVFLTEDQLDMFRNSS